MNKFRKIVASAVLAAIVFTSGIFASGCRKAPLLVLDNAVQTTVKAIENSKTNDLVEAYRDGVTINTSFPVGEMLSSKLGLDGLRFDASINTKISADKDGQSLEFKLAAGKNIGAEALVYSNKDYIVFSSDLLDDAYGITKNTAQEAFDKSIFGPDGLLSFGLDFEKLAGIFALNSIEADEGSAEEIKSKAQDLFLKDYTLLKKYADAQMEGSGLFSAADVTLTLSGDGLKCYLEESEEAAKPLAEQLGELIPHSDSVDGPGEKNDKTTVKITAHISKSSEIVGLDVIAESAEKSTKVSFSVGSELKDPSYMSFDVTETKNGETKTVAAFSAENKNGAFSVKSTSEKGSTQIKGTVKQEGTTVKLTVDSIDGAENGNLALGTEIEIKAGAEVKTVTEYKDIYNLKEKDVEKISDSIEKKMMTVVLKLIGLL